MKRESVIRLGSVVVFLFLLFVALELLGLIHFTGRRDEIARQTQVKADVINYTAALTAYSNAYGTLPCGDNAAVTAVLLGKNLERHTFLHAPPQRLSARGEFLDPKKQPYEIEVGTNTIRINRRAK
jgi:hypothetical protein